MSTAWKIIRVFISSTFKDMQAERDHLVRFVFPRLKERLLKYRIHFVDVDLRWGVTGSEDAGEICREVIGECRPRFLGMLGGRYGWVPPPKWITAGEYAALLSGTSNAGPLTAEQHKALEVLYSHIESSGDFRLQDKPEATEAREFHEAHCKTALSVLQRAGIATSITADEIDFGVLNPPDNEHGLVRAFFYFRDEVATQSIVEEKAGDYREPEGSDSARDLAELKQTIRNGGLPVFTYDAKWDATAKRLTDLRKFGIRVLRDLYRSIRSDPDLATRFASKGDSEADPFARECQDEADQMDAFIEERTERFISGSRQPLLKSLETFAAGDDAERIFVLTGEPGTGKSALLAKFCRSLTDPSSEFHNSSFIIPHFVGSSTGSTDLRRTLRRLCYELGKIVGSTEDPPLDIKELISHFQNLLAGAVAQKSGPLSPLSGSSQTAQGAVQSTIVLVFDALNQLDETDGAHWMNWLPPTLPPHVRIIASIIAPAAGQPEHRTLAILRNRKDARVVNLGPLDESDALAIIESFRKRYRKRLSPGQINALLDKEKPERFLPLFLLTALEELRTLGTDEQLTTLAPDLFSPEELNSLRLNDHDKILTTFIERVLPGTARELFQWILVNRLSTDPILASHPHGGAAGLVEKFASCLGVSRHGLSPAELTALLDPGDPLGNVAALLRLLRPYLLRRDELLDFYHGQFREAAGAAFLATPEKQRNAHQSVATCLQAFADPHRDGHCRDATPHALSELPHHQTRAEAWPDLIATLENIFFLEAKVTHGMAFGLAGDFHEASKIPLPREGCWQSLRQWTARLFGQRSGIPERRSEQQRLRLLEEAIRRDLYFIARHAQDYPQAIFQCLWNSGWCYDCSEARLHYIQPSGGWKEFPTLENRDSGRKLCTLLQRWRTEREAAHPGFQWVRELRPPFMPLGTGPMAVLSGHEGQVNGVTFSPDGCLALSGSADKTIRLWDTQSGRELLILRGHNESITAIAVSPDGSRILSGSNDKTLRLWDLKNGRELAVLQGHEAEVTSLAFSRDGAVILSGSKDKTVRLWDAKSGAELAILRGHEGEITCVAFSPDGRRALSGSEQFALPDSNVRTDSIVRMWDTHTFQELAAFRVFHAGVISVAFSPDNRRVLGGLNNGCLRTWDARAGRRLNEIAFLGNGLMIFSEDRKTVILAGSQKIRLMDIKSGRELSVLHGDEGDISSAAFSPDCRRVIIGSGDGTVRLREASGRKDPATLCGHTNNIEGLALLPGGDRILTGSGDGSLCLWDAGTGCLLETFADWNGGSVWGVAISPDGKRAASGFSDGTVRVWELSGGRELVRFEGHQNDYVFCVAFSPDGSIIASGGNDGTVRLWDEQTGELTVVRGHPSPVWSLAFSPDGSQVASGSWDSTARLWDVKHGHELALLRGHEGEVISLAFSPGGSQLVTSSWDKTTRRWDIQSATCQEIIQGTADPAAIAAGATAFPWHALSRKHETVIELAVSGSPVAWFPHELHRLTTHPNGRDWSGRTFSRLVLIRLERE